MGLAACGEHVLISRRASVYGADRLYVGHRVRIDDFALITCDGEVRISDHVHIAAHAALYGGGGIVLEDFVTVSGRSSVYSVTDDYGGDFMTNPTVPADLTGAVRRPVVLRRHVVVGAGSIVLPGVTIEEGSVTGAMTLVNRSLDAWGIYIGVPARLLRPRGRGLLAREATLHALEARV